MHIRFMQFFIWLFGAASSLFATKAYLTFSSMHAGKTLDDLPSL